MPNIDRKKNGRTWTDDDMVEALRLIREDDETITAAALHMNIPRKSLAFHYNGMKQCMISVNNRLISNNP
jgi:predicted DNA-binding protein (UPF0251 family)